jgi:hypothetical protein
MLSEAAIAYLAARTYRPDAVRNVNLVPLSGIYWDDEYPIGKATSLGNDDYEQILTLFGLRALRWRGESLSEEQQKLWDDTHTRAPTWALFHRTTICDEHLQADKFAMQTMDDFEAAMIAEAEEVDIADDGKGL